MKIIIPSKMNQQEYTNFIAITISTTKKLKLGAQIFEGDSVSIKKLKSRIIYELFI